MTITAHPKSNPNGGPRRGMTPAERAEETTQMLQMRQMGASYESIAKYYNLSRATVWQRITKHIQDMPTDDAAILRAIESRKYDMLESRLQDGIKGGDVASIKAAITLSERRCKLLGLDMPVRHEVTVDAETQALAGQVVAALEQLAALDEAA